MNEMSTNNRDYDNRDYRNYREDYRNYRDYDNRDYDNRYYDEAMHGYRNYREDYRDEDYRKRDYDRRGGKINYRDYRNYRNYRGDYHEELEIAMEDMREQYRKLEDISEMMTNPQDKNMLMKIAQKEKENYNYIKQLAEK